MLRYTLRGLRAHRTRLLLTGTAIGVGVALAAGTLMLTDTWRAAQSAAHATHDRGVDVVVRTAAPGGGGQPPIFLSPPMAPAVADLASRVDGVETVIRVVTGEVHLIGHDGRPVQRRAPVGQSIEESYRDTVREGRLPAVRGEVVVDRLTASGEHIAVGDRLRVVPSGGAPEAVTVVGILDTPSFPDTALVGFDPSTARTLLASGDEVTYLEVGSAVGAAQVRDRLTAALGPEYQVVVASELAAELAATAAEGPDFIGTVLLVASVIALFLATFLIRNTYTIILAARSRELALLRCVGASRAQLGRSVVLEAAIVGVLSGAAGLMLGIGVAKGLAVLLQTGGAITVDVIGSPSRITPRTVAVALGVGVVVASVSAWRPVRRATRVAPVAALRGDAFGVDRRAGRVRAALGGLAVAAGCAAVLIGAVAEPVRGRHIQVGSVLAAAGVLLLAPVLAPRLAMAVAAPLRRMVGIVGTLARDNAVRSPRRTAATALPIAIGLGLVGFLLTLATGTKDSVVDTVDRTLRADYQVQAYGRRTTMSPVVADLLADRPELDAVTPVRSTNVSVGADRFSVAAADPVGLASALSLDVTAGALADVGAGDIAVNRRVAEAAGLEVGSSVAVGLPDGTETFTVRAIYDADPEALALNQMAVFHFVIGPADYPRLGGPPGLDTVYASIRPGVDPDQARTAIAAATVGFPNVEVLGRDDVRQRTAALIDPALRVYYSLFALMILIALFGIANTLALSILERVREIGLLRAIGMHRGQVRAMIGWEAAILAGIGTVLGLGLGAFVGWATTRALTQTGTGIPMLALAACAAAAAVAGTLVSVVPARRAARTTIIRALATE